MYFHRASIFSTNKRRTGGRLGERCSFPRASMQFRANAIPRGGVGGRNSSTFGVRRGLPDVGRATICSLARRVTISINIIRTSSAPKILPTGFKLKGAKKGRALNSVRDACRLERRVRNREFEFSKKTVQRHRILYNRLIFGVFAF